VCVLNVCVSPFTVLQLENCKIVLQSVRKLTRDIPRKDLSTL